MMKKNSEDPYHLIESFTDSFITYVYTFLSSNFTNNINVVKGVLTPTLEYKRSKGSLSREEFQSIIRYANLLGGSYLLDYLSTEEIEKKIQSYIGSTMVQKMEKDDEIEFVTETIEEKFKNRKGILGKLKESIFS